MNSSKRKTDSVKISEKWFDGVPPQAKDHLLNSLRSLRTGQSPTHYFNLYGKHDWSVVTDFLSKDAVRSVAPNWLIEYEMSRETKFGPQGGHKPWDELKPLAELYWQRPKSILTKRPASEDEVGKYALSLQMLSAKDTLDQLKDDNSVQTRANGWRLFNLKKTDETAQRDALYLIRSGEWRKGWGYFFSRFNKQKPRLFAPMPFSANIRQAQWGSPFLKAIKADLRANGIHSKFTFWADKEGFKFLFDEIMAKQFSRSDLSEGKILYIMRDFEKMDTTVGPSQKLHSFIPRIARAFNLSETSQTYKDMKEAMLFSNVCPIATPSGMWTGDHGEASGSYVTNMAETCCNEDYEALAWKVISKCLKILKLEFGVRVIARYGNGDDGVTILWISREVLKSLARILDIIKTGYSVAAKTLGYRVQAEKWDMSFEYGKYCQYVFEWTADGLHWMYPAALILNAICNPEKQYAPADWDKDYRDLTIMEKLSNGFGLPYFHALIDYVDEGLKYPLLGRTEDDTRRILSKWDKYRSLQTTSRQFNVVTQEWEDDPYLNPVVKYILEKRKNIA